MTRFVFPFLLAGFVAFAFNAQAHGALVVDITGIPGSGQTTWKFSGSAVAGSGSGFFDDGDDLGNSDTWTDLGNYTTINDFDVGSAILSGSATVTINSATRNISFGYIDTDNVVEDDFGVGVDGNGNFHWTAGDTVSWTGTIVTNIDINNLAEAGLPVSFSTSDYGEGGGTLELELNIGYSAGAVPEPGSLVTMAVCLGAFGIPYRRARKRRNQNRSPKEAKA